jgi:hypothetical protein
VEPLTKKYLLDAFERAKAHQGRALAALGHPVSRPPTNPTPTSASPSTSAASSDSNSTDRDHSPRP